MTAIQLHDETDERAPAPMAPIKRRSRWGWWVAIALIAVAAGSVISQYVDPRYLSYVAGAGFIIIGIWTIVAAA